MEHFFLEFETLVDCFLYPMWGKQIRNLFSFVFNMFSQIKTQELTFSHFPWTKQILDKFVFENITFVWFYSFYEKKCGNKTETRHAGHPSNTELENTKKFEIFSQNFFSCVCVCVWMTCNTEKQKKHIFCGISCGWGSKQDVCEG